MFRSTWVVQVPIPALGSLLGPMIHCVISEVGDGAGSDEHRGLREEVNFRTKLFRLREKGSLKLPCKDIHHMAAHRHRLIVLVVLLRCARLHSTCEHTYTLLERKAGLKFAS